MAVDSVTSSTTTQAGATRQAAESQQAQQAQEAQQRRAEEQRKENRQEAPKPVVNTQGQTTGTLINVTA